jgi:hypothetical protein
MNFFDQTKSTRLLIQNYKSFGSEEHGFDRIEPINVIVGRNNSGKSALLDLVQFSCGNLQFSPSTHNRTGPLRVVLETLLTGAVIERVFPRGTIGGPINGNHFEFGKQYIGRRIRIGISGTSKTFDSIDSTGIHQLPPTMGQNLATAVESPLAGKSFKRLAADRDVVPEGNGDKIGITQNGNGFTNAIQRFINQASLPNDLVEKNFWKS